MESDCEIICLMLETLARVGVTAVHLDIGHMGIFRGLAEQAALSEEHEAELFDALQRKAHSEIESLLVSACVPTPIAKMILGLATLNGDSDVISRAARLLTGANSGVLDSLHRLETLAAALQDRVGDVRLHFDLAELRGYRYERGVVFAAFVPGHGQEIARGGTLRRHR